MKLRTATADDAAAIARLHTENWRTAYSAILDPEYLAHGIESDRLATWRKRLSDPAPGFETVIALGPDGSLAGFSSLFHGHDPRWGSFLDNLHTDTAVRGAGYGKALLRETARRFSKQDPAVGMYLWVFEDNEAARAFYARMGAQEVERRQSEWDLAPGAWRLRCHWPVAAELAGSVA